MNWVKRPAFRPLDPEFLADPYHIYARLRREQPVAWATTPVAGFLGFWFVSRHADVVAGLKDRRFGRDLTRILPREAFPPVPEAHRPLYAMISRWMLFKDPPEHGRLRRIAAPIFSARSVAAMRGRIEELVRAALAGIPPAGPFDIVAGFSSPLSIDIISDLLGVPDCDHALIRGWVRDIVLALDLVRTPERISTGSRRAQDLLAYFDVHIREHRRRPRETLLDVLVSAHLEGETLTHDELLAACVLFLFAGHEASSLLIGNGLLALARHPGEYRLLRSGEADLRAAVGEMLRHDSPQQIAFRHALEDFEFQGVAMRRGQTIGFGLGAANRDPEFVVDPDRLDLRRGETRHMAYGAGIHACAGSALAQLEAEIIFSALAARLPRLEVLSFERQESIMVRGLTSLAIACDA